MKARILHMKTTSECSCRVREKSHKKLQDRVLLTMQAIHSQEVLSREISHRFRLFQTELLNIAVHRNFRLLNNDLHALIRSTHAGDAHVIVSSLY